MAHASVDVLVALSLCVMLIAPWPAVLDRPVLQRKHSPLWVAFGLAFVAWTYVVSIGHPPL